VSGEQILLEAKWQSVAASTGDLAIFERKVSGKLDNTLGLFVSMEGFGPNAFDLGHQGPTSPGALHALPVLLSRKKQHAAQTGSVFIPAWQLLHRCANRGGTQSLPRSRSDE